MRSRPVHEPWDEEAIDRMLQDALAIEPSAALRARVRARIGGDVVRSLSGGVRWAWAAAAAAAVLVAAVGGRLGSRPPHAAVLEARPVTTEAAVAPGSIPRSFPAIGELDATADPREDTGARAVVDPGPPRAGGVAAVPVAVQDAEVRFAPGDRAAFLLLLAVSQTGDLPAVGALPPQELEPPVAVDAIEIPAIDIQPLVPATIVEGEPPS